MTFDPILFREFMAEIGAALVTFLIGLVALAIYALVADRAGKRRERQTP